MEQKRVLAGGEARRAPLADLEFALRNAASYGTLVVTSHFRMRCGQRGFTPPDAVVVLRNGVLIGRPEFCPDFCNWKYTVAGAFEKKELHIIAAVCAGEPIARPRVILVTGFLR